MVTWAARNSRSAMVLCATTIWFPARSRRRYRRLSPAWFMGLAATDHAVLLEPADVLVSCDSWAGFPSAAITPLAALPAPLPGDDGVADKGG